MNNKYIPDALAILCTQKLVLSTRGAHLFITAILTVRYSITALLGGDAVAIVAAQLGALGTILLI